jgi:hypothetical protein
MSDRVRFIPGQADGSRVLLIDVSGLTDPAEALPYIAEAQGVVAGQPLRSVYCLVDVTGSRFNVDVVEAMKHLAEHDRPYVIASAVVGVAGLMRVIFESVLAFSGRNNLKSLPSREEALRWLAGHSTTTTA